eukprot:1152801-Pelagomonas_calceolata.AAC.4
MFCQNRNGSLAGLRKSVRIIMRMLGGRVLALSCCQVAMEGGGSRCSSSSSREVQLRGGQVSSNGSLASGDALAVELWANESE